MFEKLRRQCVLLTLICASCCIATPQTCGTCTNSSPEPIQHVPAPWTLKGTIYSLILLPQSHDLPAKAFPPFERQFPDAIQGDYVGGVGMIQVLRYTESPVGPYDELLLVPGFFDCEIPRKGGGKETRRNARVSRIYVSQKFTARNGRENWNIPKHLAAFNWSTTPTGASTLKLHPFDTSPSESQPAPNPWFQFTFTPTPVLDLLPLPFSTSLYTLVGINATLLQPPLPAGHDAFNVLAGTERWRATVPGQASGLTTVGTFDMKQDEGGAGRDEFFENFWPGLGRFVVGLKMERAVVTFSEPEVF